ncbi:DNA-binding response regulator [Roseibium algicola]|uniref:DNA-binding response regulator n=1 Tax=Roseibium algicola TaxID=2857014 RepID=A0ABM6I3B1_9HYPH|nr:MULTISPECIES: response regulator transcription factor [Stappiaceae]MCR9284040.1 response regulator transcription factor [Paracoccaceae bacterium]MEC9401440.1 response regulator transcription factor [Pseudomonadota bacterium]AQQ04864.1 DNA-binding response regulator [Roseibium aggregatum]ERP86062.1 transcriptional regulator [Labrenzia sp. C1B10]ERS06024.1 transcriptional regulator [Labrenzia sp. C1B70]
MQTRSLQATKRTVFIVDDEPEIGNLLLDALLQFEMEGKVFSTASQMLIALGLETPDACIVDLGLPDMEGMALINEIRRRSSVPIIVLSARGHSTDRVMGLELGADDYVVKPFDPREVVARIRSILRRSSDQAPVKASVDCARFEGWTYQPASHCLTSPEGEETFLSTGEATLLEALLRAPKRVLSRDYLLEHGGRDESLDRSIDVRISRIRKKLNRKNEPAHIRTIYGSGYMLACDVKWS